MEESGSGHVILINCHVTINAPNISSLGIKILGKHFPSPPAGYIPPPPPQGDGLSNGTKSMISPVVNKKMALPSLPADLMTAIREGIALKKVPETAKSEKSANSQTVAATILARRIAMQMSYSDDESADSKGGSDWDA